MSDNGGGRTLSGDPAEPLPSNWARPNSAPRVGRIGDWSGTSSSRGGSTGGGSRFGTLSSLNSGGGGGGGRGPVPDDDDEDEDDEENKGPQSWFTGGERSGLSVQNPERQRQIPGGDMVRDLLRRAAEASPAPEEPARRPGAFFGGGHTLGSEDVESSYIPDPTAEDEEEETAIRHLTIWRNGFQVEDGELMRFDDPAQAQILAEINAGQAPLSVLNVRQGQHVELRLTKRLDEDYVPPKGAKIFSGSGNRLGAVVPEVASGSHSAAMPGGFPSTSSPASPPAEKAQINTKFEVDQSQPTTSIQIRLADGTRIVARMNLTHTVGDIRNFINASRPENLTRPYTIGTTFPNRTLEDDTATIQAAGLVNSVIVQRWA